MLNYYGAQIVCFLSCGAHCFFDCSKFVPAIVVLRGPFKLHLRCTKYKLLERLKMRIFLNNRQSATVSRLVSRALFSWLFYDKFFSATMLNQTLVLFSHRVGHKRTVPRFSGSSKSPKHFYVEVKKHTCAPNTITIGEYQGLTFLVLSLNLDKF